MKVTDYLEVKENILEWQTNSLRGGTGIYSIMITTPVSVFSIPYEDTIKEFRDWLVEQIK